MTQPPHFAAYEYQCDSKISELPEDHQWNCNASLTSWPSVLPMWIKRRLPCIYLCVPCVRKFSLRMPPMRTAAEEIDRSGLFCDMMENLIASKGTHAVLYPGNIDHLLLTYWSLGFDLHKALLTAMKARFYSGGYALLRPLVEAHIRACLVIRNAGDDLALIKSDDYRVDFDTVGFEIDKAFGLEGYLQSLLNQVQVLHSLTHSGLAQLVRRFDKNGIGANYDDEEIIEVVRVATKTVFLLNNLVTKHLGYEQEWNRNTELLVEWNKPH